ncbi:MAG: outer membrane protein assembly factor BamB family protein, partial [Candidatus Thorarchaeota archaeon]
MPSGGFMYVYIFGFSVRNFYSIAGPVARFLDASNPYSGGGKLYNEHADLVYGINPSSRFVHYNVRGVADMDAGDTDNDGRREVIAGFDDKVGVYELEHSNLAGDEMQHKEKWVSNAFPYDVTGVTVYDMNGNGYEEIGVSAERGEVFVFEVDDSALPPVDLGFGEEVWTVSDAGSVWSDDIRNNRMVSCDIDDDGRQEIIMGMENGTIAAFDDDGDAMLWSYSGVSSYVYVMDLKNTTEGPRLAVSYGDGNYTFLNAASGALLWRRVFTGAYLFGHVPGFVAIADVAPSAGPEVIGTNSVANMTVWAADGSVLWTHYLGGMPWFAMRIAAGNFSGRAQFDIAVTHWNGSVTFLYGNNGTVIRHLDYMIASLAFNPVVFDYNSDGFDDIAIYYKRLAVLDGHTGDMLYNSTNDIESSEYAYYLYVSDYDADSQPEAIIVTDKAVYYEEFSSGRRVWSYDPPATSIRHASTGFFAGDRAGLALALQGGGLVALDALTGRVLWFDIEPHTYRAAVAVDIDGDGYDEIAGSLDNGTLYVVRRLAPGYGSRPEVFEPWTTYWSGHYGSDVRGVWAYDLDGDSVDELVVADLEHVWAYSTKSMSLLWNASSSGCSIHDVKFGDLDGDGSPDLLVYGRTRMGLSSVFALDGATGTSISTIDHTFSDDVAGILVGNFLTSVDGDEYVVVMTESSPTNTYAICFSEGRQRFVTNVNMTHSVGDIAVGEFDGNAGLDFVVAAGTVVTFYSGQCVRQHYYLTGTSVDDIAVGDFDNNGIDDAIASSDRFVRTINASADNSNFWLASWTEPITFVETGDWDSNTGALEVAVGLTGGDIIVGQGDALNWFGAWDSGSFMGP